MHDDPLVVALPDDVAAATFEQEVRVCAYEDALDVLARVLQPSLVDFLS